MCRKGNGFSFLPALDTDPSVTPRLLVDQAESSLAPKFWDSDQNHCRWSPAVWLKSVRPGLLAFLLAELHQRNIHTQSRQGLLFPECRSMKCEPSRSRSLQRMLGESSALWWVLNKYWEQNNCWGVNHVSGQSVQKGDVRSHSQGKVCIFFFHLTCYLKTK